MTNVRLLVVPYDSGHRGIRMGAGPQRLLDAGITDRLEAEGHTVDVVVVEPPTVPIQAEISCAFEVAAALSTQVSQTRAADAFPVVLAGNCITAVGTVSGLEAPIGVLWFDCHGDLNTPETTASGFLDGMAVSVLTGRCWGRLAGSVPGFTPVLPADVLLVGVRDLDDAEAALIADTDLSLASPAAALQAVPAWVDGATSKGRQIYLHLDLDVMDPSDGRVNQFATDGGLSRAELRSLLCEVIRRSPVGALTLSAYDPDADKDGRALEAALDLVCAAVGAIPGAS